MTDECVPQLSPGRFSGFSPLQSNVTYTPNQFFDVVLRYASRPTVRIVSYMLRKTLGWCDEYGNPQDEEITVSYSNLMEHANVGRSTIRSALDEAVEYCFLNCLRDGKHNRTNASAVSAVYDICWDEETRYTGNLREFNGFYARDDANRTYVPNQFFDFIVRNEPLSVIKVVGAIIRNTIGYSTKAGFRRQFVRKSFDELIWATRLTRKHLNNALQTAIAKNYICRIETGYFDKNGGRLSRASVYAVSWAREQDRCRNQSGNSISADQPQKVVEISGSKRIPDHRIEKDTRSGSKRIPGKRIEKDTDNEIKFKNKTSINQQHAVAVESDYFKSFKLLISEGITESKAAALSQKFPYSEIKNQRDWLDHRTITRSRTGLLIKAIENRLPPPEAGTSQNVDAAILVSNYYAARAGNGDTPIADPSNKEIQLADMLLTRLLEISPGSDPLRLGRRFGEFVSKAANESAHANKSFVYAVRNHGDNFFVFLKNHATRLRQANIEKAKATHREKYLSGYHKYLDEKEQEIKVRFPDVYAAFLEKTENQKKRNLSLVTDEKCIATFDSPESKRHRFFEYFRNDSHSPVADFWTWDRELNGNSFDAGAES